MSACVDAAWGPAVLQSPLPGQSRQTHSPLPWILMEPRPGETAKCRRDREGGQAPPHPRALLPGVLSKVASDVMPLLVRG